MQEVTNPGGDLRPHGCRTPTTGLSTVNTTWPHKPGNDQHVNPTMASGCLPSQTCWWTWSMTTHTLYMGSRNGICLQCPLGAWLPHYMQQCFWKRRLHNPEHLLFKHSSTAPTCVGLKTQHCQTLTKFSPTILTNIEFTGPPVTPIDTTTGYIRTPNPPLPTTQFPTMARLTTQCCKANSVMVFFHGNKHSLVR